MDYDYLNNLLNILAEQCDILGQPKNYCCEYWSVLPDGSETVHQFENYKSFPKLAKNQCQLIMFKHLASRSEHHEGKCI
jgi:hypothetical protein